MIRKWIPLVRYNPYNKIFKWEYGVEAIWEHDENEPEIIPRSPGATSDLHRPAALTKRGAVRKAEKRARRLNETVKQNNREWERV